MRSQRLGVMRRVDCALMEKAMAGGCESRVEGLPDSCHEPRATRISSVRRTVARRGVPTERIVFGISERETNEPMTAVEKFIGHLKPGRFRALSLGILRIGGDFLRQGVDRDPYRTLPPRIAPWPSEPGTRTVAEYAVAEAACQSGIDESQCRYRGRPLAALGA